MGNGEVDNGFSTIETIAMMDDDDDDDDSASSNRRRGT